jgi:hypothetical protein
MLIYSGMYASRGQKVRLTFSHQYGKASQGMDEQPSPVPNKVKLLSRIEAFTFIFFNNFFIILWFYILLSNVEWLLRIEEGNWPIETSFNASFRGFAAGIFIGLLYSLYEANKPKAVIEGGFFISKKDRILGFMGILTFVTWIWAIVVLNMIGSRG